MQEPKQMETQNLEQNADVKIVDEYKKTGTAGIKGGIYQVKLLMLFLLRGLKKDYPFRLATEMEEAEKFDDLVFEYIDENNQKNYRFLQAKHRENWEKTEKKMDKINIDDLLTEGAGNYGLLKYFRSFLKIKQKAVFKDCILRDFIIFTNINFNFEDQKNELVLRNAFIKAVDDDILKTSNEGLCYKFKEDFAGKELLYEALRKACDSTELARKLTESVLYAKRINHQEKNSIFKLYHAVLAKEVVNVTDGEFHSNFLDTSYEDLPQEAKEFRNIFKEEIENEIKRYQQLSEKEKSKKKIIFNLDSKQDVLELIKEKQEENKKKKEKQKILILSSGFGSKPKNKQNFEDTQNKSSSNIEVITEENFPKEKVTDENIKDFLNHLVFAVNQPDEVELGDIIKMEISQRFNKSDSQNIYSQLYEKISDWMKEIAGRFLSHEDGKNFMEQILGREGIWFEVRNPVNLFTGREEELERLHETLQRKHGKEQFTVISQMTSISGLGGIGKTELAKKYAHNYGKDYDNNVIWINAESVDTLVNSFLNLAKHNRIGIPTKNVDSKNKSVESIVAEIYSFFGKRKSLFIFDNAEKCNDFKKFLPLHSLTPDCKKPYILFTSRDREWGEGIEVLDLSELKLMDAIEFVKLGLALPKEDTSQDQVVTNLVEKLQSFPLALQQAVSYIKDQKVTREFKINDYLPEYEKKTKYLLESKVFKDIQNEYAKTTFTTWQITIDKVASNEEYGKLALEILDVIAYCAPEKCNRELFLNLAEGDEDKLRSAIRLLIRYSMLNGENYQSLLSIHRLVQEVTRINIINQNREEKVIIKVFELLENGFPYRGDKLKDYDKKRELLPHLETFLLHVDNWLAKNLEKTPMIEKNYVVNLLKWMSNGYGDLGYPRRSKELLEWELKINQKHFGPDHFEVAKTLSNLANSYGDLGDPSKSKQLLKCALIINEKHYGPDHFEVATTLVNLANSYINLGNPSKSKQLLERALVIDETHYGPDHFEVARTLGNLANSYRDLGDPSKSKQLLERALIIDETHYGLDHFEVARTLSNLANSYGDLGDPSKSKQLLRRALIIKETHYGPDHFEVAKTLGNLANSYGELGDPRKSKQLLKRALIINEKRYGPDSFIVARTLVNLANSYINLGTPSKSKHLLERALVINEKYYGPDHFDVAKTLVNLAISYRDLGDTSKSKHLLERALIIEEKHYGPDHFKVARTLVNLAISYKELVNPSQSKQLLQRALIINEKHYGPDHLEVARTLVTLANSYTNLGDPSQSKQLLERALIIKEKHYGPDHFEVAIVLGNLAISYGDLGDPSKSKHLLERTLIIIEKHYGPNHCQVANVLVHLGLTFRDLGDHKKKTELLKRALVIQEKYYGRDHVKVKKTLLYLGDDFNALEILDNSEKK